MTRIFFPMLFVAGAACLFTALPASIASAAPASRQTDLARTVEGVWHGAVTSDVRGSSRDGVTITVTRIAPNRVRISCDYARIPTVEVDLMAAGGSIMNAKSGVTFLVEMKRDANRLDLYIDQAALIVRR
jgi:hypothetical protein